MDTYKPVRALERGLDLLLELNRLGRGSTSVLGAAAGVDRTTTHRLLATLQRRGLVNRSLGDGCWFLDASVRHLSDGYVEADRVLQIVEGALAGLLAEIPWPCDFATFDRGEMRIRATTHHFSPFSVHRAMIGRSRPLRSALGRAMLAGAAAQDRQTMLEIARSVPGVVPFSERELDDLDADYSRRGYAWSIGGVDPAVSAIACPLVSGGRVRGAVNIIFFRRVHTPEQIAARHLADLKQMLAAVEAAIADGGGAS